MRILNESRRDDMLLPYVNLLRGKGINTNVSQLKQYLLAKFVNEGLIRNLSLSSNFYLAGVAKYYFNGDLTTNKVLNVFDESQEDVFNREICDRLNACILILRNAHIDSVGTEFEQPEDFGNLKLNALLRKYNKKINEMLGIVTEPKKRKKAEEEIDTNVNVGNGYTFDIIYSFEEAKKYNKYTEPGAWCITYAEQHYRGYIRNLGIHYVILRQNGFENVPRKKGENWTKQKPQDEYGNSLIALLQSNKTGEPVYITSRWNHGVYKEGTTCEADHAYTKEELFAVTGLNDADLQRIQKIWLTTKENKKSESSTAASLTKKKTTEILRYVKYGQMRMNGGENLDVVFPEAKKKYLYGNPENYKKGIFALMIPMQGEEETVWASMLCDKGKIRFESFFFHGNVSYGLQRTYNSSEKPDEFLSQNYNNLIVIEHDKKYVMFYDIKRHTFVDVEGTTKFKYHNWSGPNNWKECIFYEVAMSNNQRAFIDWKTNKPLRLPNGGCWFESVATNRSSKSYYGNEVKINDVYDDTSCLLFTRDSAANEKYFYDVPTRNFFNVENEKNYDVSLFVTTNTPTETYELIFTEPNDWHQRYSVLYKHGKPLTVNGYDKFQHISFVGNGTIGNFRTDDGKFVMDMSTNEILKPVDYEGNPINFDTVYETSQSTPRKEYEKFVFLRINSFNYYNNCVLYDIENNRCILNPYTGGYIFYTYTRTFGSHGDAYMTMYLYPYHLGAGVPRIAHPNPKVNVTIKQAIEYTEQHASEAGALPVNEYEDAIRYTKKHPENVSDEFKAYIVWKKELNDWESSKDKEDYKMAEQKLNLNDINFIINEIINKLK